MSLRKSSTAYQYLISGLQVLSDRELPSAIPHSFTGAPDITLRETTLPAAEEPLPDTGEAVFRFRIPELGRFLMRGGRELLYEPAPGCDAGLLPLHLTGICFATLLQQRGSVVLHASAVGVGGRAMLFCGESGAGKSTLAALLADRGFPLLNDDVCSLTEDREGRFNVAPDGRMLKLWAASLEQLREPARGAEVIGRTDKFYALPALSDGGSHTVGGIYLLAEQSGESGPCLSPLSRARAMTALHENAYRGELVRAMGQQISFFRAAAQLCAAVPVLELRRQKSFAEADTVVSLLQEHWQMPANSR